MGPLVSPTELHPTRLHRRPFRRPRLVREPMIPCAWVGLLALVLNGRSFPHGQSKANIYTSIWEAPSRVWHSPAAILSTTASSTTMTSGELGSTTNLTSRRSLQSTDSLRLQKIERPRHCPGLFVCA